MKNLMIALLAVMVAVPACKNSQTASNSKEEEKEMVSTDSSWESKKNEDGSYTLTYQVIKPDAKQPNKKADFYISDSEGNKVFEESIYGGYVKWYDNTKIEYFSPPGMIRQNEDIDDYAVIYDIEMGKSYKKSDLKN